MCIRDRLYSIDNDAFGCASSDVNVVSMVVPTKISLIKLRRELDIKPPELFSTKRIDCSLTELKFSEPISEISINVNNFELINNNNKIQILNVWKSKICLLYTSPSPRDRTRYRMPSSA